MKVFNILIYIILLIKTLRIEKFHGVDGGNSLNPPHLVDDIQRIDISKSPNDKRLYRGLKLQNGLTVLLISDQRSNKSGASLRVGAGTLHEPKEIPGLAHLLEHMLHRGNEKYPQINDLKKFVYMHDGYTTAVTKALTQSYQFEINSSYFSEALERFAEMFLRPLIDESVMEGEVIDIDLEFKTVHTSNDFQRYSQLIKSLSKEGHPYNHFSAGNIETLSTVVKSKGVSLRDKLLEFHSTWYSSNIMYLAVYAPDDLNRLEGMVSKLFGSIPNKNVKSKIYDEHPWGPEQVGHKIYTVPFLYDQMLGLTFPVPDMISQYKVQHTSYISDLIGYQGPGSLFSVLRRKGWCRWTSSSYTLARYDKISGMPFFVVELSLLEEGLQHIDEIITLIFRYIQLLNNDGIREEIFKERKKLKKMAFTYKEDEDIPVYLESITKAMNSYPLEDVLSFELQDEWEPYVIKQFLAHLTPINMNVFVMSKSFEAIADRVEPWYGIKYKVERIPQHLIEKWQMVEHNLPFQLQFPPPNKFLAQNLQLYRLHQYEPKKPYVIKKSTISRMWFKQDDIFFVPKLNVLFEIFSPITCFDASYISLTSMFINMIKTLFNEETYAAKLAGYEFKIDMADNCGIEVQLFGFSEKMPVFLKTLMSLMTNIRVNEKSFHIFKETRIRVLKNLEAISFYTQVNFYIASLMKMSNWSVDELLIVTEKLQFYDLQKFLSQVFSRIFIQGLIHGNCDLQKAFDIINIIEGSLAGVHHLPLFPSQLLPPRQVQLPDGSNFVYEMFNKSHSSSCYMAYFQSDIESTSKMPYFVLELFQQIVRQPCRDMLRRQERIGYLVECSTYQKFGVQAFSIFVVSDKHPQYIDERVEDFLQTINKMLSDMTEEEFNMHKMAVVSRYQGYSKGLKRKSSAYWYEISNRFYDSPKSSSTIDDLHSLKKTDLIEFFDVYMDVLSERRHKLAIHIISQVTNPSLPNDAQLQRVVKIKDITSFKNSLNLFPLPSQYKKNLVL